MSQDKKNTVKENPQPKKISKEEADRLNNYAQGLDEEVTHVVDYGDVLGDDLKDG